MDTMWRELSRQFYQWSNLLAVRATYRVVEIIGKKSSICYFFLIFLISSGNLLDFEDDFEQSSVQAVNPADSNRGRPAESTSGKRGIPCTLPADFLVVR